MSDTPAGRPFHGRSAELELLRSALRGAVAHGASAVLLGGDAGVGKTRLVTEFGRSAVAEGTVVLTGRALDIADAPSFWPVVSALREHARSGTGEVARTFAAALGDLDGSAGASASGRVEMLGELCGLVGRAARESPVVLVVDDLHWADRSTRDLFAYLLAGLATEPVLLVGTYRDDPAGGIPAVLLPLVTELRRHRAVTFRQVRPLPRAELAELLGVWEPDRPDLEPLVWAHSAGNVFLAEETVRAVLDGDPRGVPQTVRELVRAGAAGLSPVARQVVRAMAAGIGDVEHPLLAAVVDRPGAELAVAVREAVDAGFVVAAGDDGYALRHGLMSEVVAGDLLPAERIDLHERFARALSTHDGPGGAARLAHHWQRAGHPAQALAATLSAAEEAERLRGYAEAHRHWLRAATLPVAGAAAARGGFLEKAAAAAELAGDHESAVALLSERLSGPEAPTGLDEAVLRSRLARYLMAAGQVGEAQEAARRAVAVLPGDSADGTPGTDAARAEVLAGYATALLAQAEFSAAREVAQEALVPARRVGEPRALASLLSVLGFGAAFTRDGEAGLEALSEAVGIAEASGDPVTLGECLQQRAELLSGPLNALDDGVAEALAGAERMAELGLGRTAAVSLRALAANGMFRRGSWDDAERQVALAWAAAPAGAQAVEVRLARARLRMGRGDLDGSEEDLAAVELVAGSAGLPKLRLPLLILRAGLEMWRGRPELAREHVGAGLDVVESGIDDVWAYAPLLWHGARAHSEAVLAGRAPDPSGLRKHRSELVARGDRSVPALRAVLATFEAMCTAEDARVTPGADPGIWAGVADLLERLGQPYPTAYARLRSAEALLGARRAGAGTDELGRAASGAWELRAAPLLAEIAGIARRARAPIPELPATVAPLIRDRTPHTDPAPENPLTALTDRELEVLEVLAGGATNKEIATTLFIAPKTVGAHLARIFAKLGVSNRTQAAGVLRRYVPERGVTE
ncbi:MULTISPECIES: helix-turn-helix transcriptional regulator [Pseudonocardia]|uniref:Transcriptional regulatory protein LiaR n=2 Tax=Pseudonocardia TaxID=1847 RepID=A0A1Y2MIP8_PSEAH|nr:MULTISPECIES: helix-turn-helix transcriptional regulator [Pseudonocardia]OSY35144.1 Transcriptional regulatory protein LiaR [Pseudonocardia autotrophica]TDN72124.1 regulatory LuxR family protein [Pseudonocardia autotrophica]BBG02831.1 LuxR family transcriptional regulator [Pseudonocardia autotrophica]GEC26150.1 LuxR family transcriptional regulator [Pseudonocardia saturnea]